MLVEVVLTEVGSLRASLASRTHFEVKSLTLKSHFEVLSLASKVKSLKPQVRENCPALGLRTALYFELLKFCRSPEKLF